MESHAIVAKGMEWDDLAETIIQIEFEIIELSPLMSDKELKKYHKLLKIYEGEKEKRIDNSKKSRYRTYPMYGDDYVTSWNANPEDYF